MNTQKLHNKLVLISDGTVLDQFGKKTQNCYPPKPGNEAIKEFFAKAASEIISNGTENEEEEKKQEERETFGDWGSILQRLNDQVKLIESYQKL